MPIIDTPTACDLFGRGRRGSERVLGEGVTPPVPTWCTQQLLEIIA